MNKNNKLLAERIEKGLNIAIENGDFDREFYNHSSMKPLFKEGNIKNRRIFKIPNPFLTEETKKLLDDDRLWYLP